MGVVFLCIFWYKNGKKPQDIDSEKLVKKVEKFFKKVLTNRSVCDIMI